MKIEINKSEIRALLNDIDRKLLLVKGEGSDVKRGEIIDSILENENGEIQQLEKLLKL